MLNPGYGSLLRGAFYGAGWLEHRAPQVPAAVEGPAAQRGRIRSEAACSCVTVPNPAAQCYPGRVDCLAICLMWLAISSRAACAFLQLASIC